MNHDRSVDPAGRGSRRGVWPSPRRAPRRRPPGPPPPPAPREPTTPSPNCWSASPSTACASTRRRCRRSPTRTTARGSRGPRATTRRSTTSVRRLRRPPATRHGAVVPVPDLRLPRAGGDRARLARPCRAGGEQRSSATPAAATSRAGHGPARPPPTRRPGARRPTTPTSRPAGSARHRGACTFATRPNAYAAGASAVVIVNNVDGDLNGTLGEGSRSTSRSPR